MDADILPGFKKTNVAIGMWVEVAFLDGEDGFTLPQFRLIDEPPRGTVWQHTI